MDARARVGLGALPIVLSTNFFLWFRDDVFALQLAPLAVISLGREFLRWNRDGKNTHIFNRSAFGLSVASIVLIAFHATSLIWGIEVASTLGQPPWINVHVFLVGLIVQGLFSVTLMTVSAVAALWACGTLFELWTGTYFFIDTNLPIAIFLGMHLLLTDPATSPRTNAGRVAYGAAYGVANVVLFAWLIDVAIPEFYDKLLPVPLLNLCVPLLDRGARQLAGTRWSLGALATTPRVNAAEMGCWALSFGLLWSTGWLAQDHPGKDLALWRKAAQEGKPRAERNLF